MDKQYISFSSLKARASFYAAWMILVTGLLLGACSPTKQSYYFKTLAKDTTLTGLVNKDLESKITQGDNLAINISSLDKTEDLVFNTGISGEGTATAGFLVDKQGAIVIHKIGKLKVEGMTRKELALEMQKQLAPYLKDPIVTVQYLNHKITVLGEVVRPQVLNMPEEQLSLIDVLVLSGDLNEKAKKSDIMVIRENGNEKKVKHVNLEDHSIFSSPWYYAQPNDIIVVNPDFEKTEREFKRTRLQSNLGIAVSTISLLIIIIDRVLR